MKINIPDFSLVLLIGPSSSGKSTFAKKHFKPSEIVSSDYCRELISDDENNQTVTKEAFDLLNNITKKRLELRKLTVIDATNVTERAREELISIGKEAHSLIIAIVFNLEDKDYYDRNKERTDRFIGNKKLGSQIRDLRNSIDSLKEEGFNYVYIFNSTSDVENAKVYRKPLYCDLRNEHGPFDIIGDIHGCFDEMKLLLEKLGYKIETLEVDNDIDYKVTAPIGRRVIFLGDLVDRGPKIVDVLRLAMNMVHNDIALCVPGNHDNKLLRKLKGANVQVKHGLEDSVEQLKGQSDLFTNKVRTFFEQMSSHYILDDEKLVVAHAGMKESYQGRTSKRVRDFALYGETTGDTDQYGLPVRYLWARDYKGKAKVLYGHTPVLEVLELNNTINIDTGCVFGNKLTAYRYPENEFVVVKALKQYAIPSRPVGTISE